MTTDNPLPVADAARIPPGSLSDEAIYGMFLREQSPNTMRAYELAIRDLGRYLRPADPLSGGGLVKVLRRLGGAEVNLIGKGYRIWMTEAGLDRSTIAGRISVLRSLCRSMRRDGLIDYRPEIAVKPVTSYRDTRGPSREQFKQLLAAVGPPDSAKRSRDRAILLMLYTLALRRFQATELNLEDVELDRMRVQILEKGGGTTHFPVTIPPIVEQALRTWLRFRGMAPGPLFTGLGRDGRRTRLTGKSVRDVVMKAGRTIGLKVSPHPLKHASITDALIQENGNITAVQAFSRHKKVETVIRYNHNRLDTAGAVARGLADGLE